MKITYSSVSTKQSLSGDFGSPSFWNNSLFTKYPWCLTDSTACFYVLHHGMERVLNQLLLLILILGNSRNSHNLWIMQYYAKSKPFYITFAYVCTKHHFHQCAHSVKSLSKFLAIVGSKGESCSLWHLAVRTGQVGICIPIPAGTKI